MRHPEANIQKAILGLIRVKYPRVLAFAVPNGGSRNVREAVNLKAQGVLAGVADLCLMWSPSRVGFMEVKAEKGKLSPPQLKFMDACIAREIPWECVRSVDDADGALKLWGCA